MLEKRHWLNSLVLAYIVAFPIMGVLTPFDDYINRRVFTVAALSNVEGEYFYAKIQYLLAQFIFFSVFFVNFRGFLKEATYIKLIIIFLSWMLLSIFWSLDPGNTIRRGARAILYVGLVVYMVHCFSFAQFIRISTRVLLGAFVGSALMAVVVPSYGLSGLEGYSNAWRGIFTEKNAFGAAISVGLLIVAFSYYLRTNNRLTSLFTLVLGLGLLVMCRSATALVTTMVCFGFLTVVVIFRSDAHPAVRLSAALALLIALGTLVGLLIASDGDLFSLLGRSSDLTGRTDVWRLVREEITHRPWLGYGFGFWESISREKFNIWNQLDWAPPHSHDDWLDVTLQLGFIGFAMLALCWIVTIGRLSLVLFTPQRDQALFCLLLMVNLFVRSLTETIMIDPAISGWPWFAFAYLYAAHLRRDRRNVADPVVQVAAPPVQDGGGAPGMAGAGRIYRA